jgi:hypothetical protein
MPDDPTLATDVEQLKAERERERKALEWVAQNMPELLVIRDLLLEERKRG